MTVDESSLKYFSSVFPFKCRFCYFAAQDESTLNFHFQLEHDSVKSSEKQILYDGNKEVAEEPIQVKNEISDDLMTDDESDYCSDSCKSASDYGSVSTTKKTFNSGTPSVTHSYSSGYDGEAAPQTSNASNLQNHESKIQKDKSEAVNKQTPQNMKTLKPVILTRNQMRKYFGDMNAGKFKSPNLFTCCYPDCGYQVMFKSEFTMHLRKSHKDFNGIYYCIYCDLYFDRRIDTIGHMFEKHCNELYICEICNNFFTDEEAEWNKHIFKRH